MAIEQNKATGYFSQNAKVKIIYILYLSGLLLPIAFLAGAVCVMIFKCDERNTEVDNVHYHFQLRTFWIGLALFCISLITMPIIIGIFVWGFSVVWLLVRCIKGLQYVGHDQYVKNPNDYFFNV